MDETLVYRRGTAVGREVEGRIYWFPSAPREAIEELNK